MEDKMQFWTDYPIVGLGDKSGEVAPIRKVTPISYDNDKYVKVSVAGVQTEIKRGYLYLSEHRVGEGPCISHDDLASMYGVDE